MKLSTILQMAAFALFASLPSTPSPSSASSTPPPPPPPAHSSKRQSLIVRSVATKSPLIERHQHHHHHHHQQQHQTTTTYSRSAETADDGQRQSRQQQQQQQQERRREERARHLRTFKATLLRILGLTSEPKPKTRVPVPDYMWQLYDQATKGPGGGGAGGTRRRQTKVTKRHGTRPQYEGNTVRIFESFDFVSVESTAIRFHFNLSNDLDADHFNAAELRVFLEDNDTRDVIVDAVAAADVTADDRRYKIGVYQVLPTAATVTRILLEVKVVERVLGGGGRWESFDVSAAVRSWKEHDGGSSLGLEVKVTTADDRPLAAADFSRVRIRRTEEEKEEEEAGEREEDQPEAAGPPLLVTYGDDRTQLRDDVYDDVTRQQQQQQRRRHHHHHQQQHQLHRLNGSGSVRRKRSSSSHNRRKLSGGKASQCRRRPLYIDFRELEWNDWIFAPPGYDAFLCNGTCPVVLPDHLNATNHAQIQSLLHSVDRSVVPAPCCVPTALSTISMLYVNEMDRVVLKNYEDMVVDACGCR